MSNQDCLKVATDAELVAELATRIVAHHAGYKQRAASASASRKATGQEREREDTSQPGWNASRVIRPKAHAEIPDPGEDLIDDLLAQTKIQKFVNYWKLGDYIYDENPYFEADEISFTFDPDKDQPEKAGILEKFDASFPFLRELPLTSPPKAKNGVKGKIKAWYYRLGRSSGKFGHETEADKPKYERNIVKEIEIEYGPPIAEFDAIGRPVDEVTGHSIDGGNGVLIDKDSQEPIPGSKGTPKMKLPHIIVLYGGGDH